MDGAEASAPAGHDEGSAGSVVCIRCGYDLRGHSGDPCICPECGHQNSLADVRIPEKLIEKELRQLETTPTACIVGFGLCVTGVIFFALGTFAAGLIVGGIGSLVWLTCSVYFGMMCGFRHGWLAVLLWFHLASILTVFVLAAVTFALMALYVYELIPEWALLVIMIVIGLGGMFSTTRRLVFGVCSSLGCGRVSGPYEHARARLGCVYRETAVRRVAKTTK